MVRMSGEESHTSGRPGGVRRLASPTLSDAISTEGLLRRFDDALAVDDVNLSIPVGEIYGFLGPNGAGKSTTVLMLCTLLAPSAGRAVVAGFDVATDPGQVRLRIGVALQEAALDPNQTGVELLRLQGQLYGLDKRSVDQRLGELGELIDRSEEHTSELQSLR